MKHVPAIVAAIVAIWICDVGGQCQDSDNGNTDVDGDSCKAYSGPGCGKHDDSDFDSMAMCCACGGGTQGGQCQDSDNGHTDVDGDGCKVYSGPGCGKHDDSDFDSMAMCCACGGGTQGGGGGANMPCGRDTGRVVGGSETGPYSLPWQAGLVPKNRRRPFCGGTIISTRHILTAAHCTEGKGSRFDVVVGEHDTNSASDGTIHKVSRVVEHPSYVNGRNRAPNFDFAIVTLRTPISFGLRANAACLPTRSYSGDFLVGKTLTVSGWGALSQGGGSPTVLHSVRKPGLSNSRCNNLYNGQITSQMLCAGRVSGGIDSCQGDSGGPLTYTAKEGTAEEGPTTLVGVVSWGEGCAQKRRPGVYARVTSVLEWIKSNMN